MFGITERIEKRNIKSKKHIVKSELRTAIVFVFEFVFGFAFAFEFDF